MAHTVVMMLVNKDIEAGIHRIFYCVLFTYNTYYSC